MFSTRIPSALAGATAFALLMGSTAIAQQQSTDQSQTAPAAAGQTTGSGDVQQAFAQVEQLLQQADQSLQQEDPETARAALEEANALLQEPAGAVDESAMVDLQAQIEQALSALDDNDMEVARESVQDANDTMMQVSQASGQQSGEQPAQVGQTMTVDQTTGQQQTGQQMATQQPAQQPGMEQGAQIDQQTLQQLRDELETAQMDLQSAMDAVAQARQLLDGMTPAMAAAEGTQQTAEANREIPRLSAEETQRLLSVGDRQIGNASEVVVLTVSDLEGRDVLSYEGERLGEIERIINNGGQTFATIEHGGFLGIGETEVAIPMGRLGLRGDDLILLGLTEEQMKALPDYDYQAGEELEDEQSIEIGLYQ